MNNGRKECTLFWFIENYSYSWNKNLERLISPRFVPDGLESTFWYLWLYPRGKKIEIGRKLSIHLGQGSCDTVKEPFPLNYEISVITADGSLLKLEEGEFKPGGGSSSPESVVLGEVILRRNAEYLLEDTLKVRCQIWYEEGMGIQAKGEYFARTRIGIEKISFIHKVENFSTLSPKVKSSVHIRSDSVTGFFICSTVHVKKMPSNQQLVIVKILPSNECYHLCKLKVSIVTESGQVIECDKYDNRLDGETEGIRKLGLSLRRKDILNKKTELLPNDELTLLCECDFSTGIEEEVEYNPVYQPFMVNINPLFKTVPCRKSSYFLEKLSACPSALDDLITFYKSQHLADVVLKTKTNSFPVHKLVLCSRSTVFKDMLTSDMEKKNTVCIQVDDLEDETVQQLLLFLYSDNIENLKFDSAIKLYHAANKYAIEKLKLMCSSFLVLNINTCNAIELFLLANRHNDCDLKNLAEDFILEHEEEVYGSDEWERLSKTNPLLVIKTMLLKYNS